MKVRTETIRTTLTSNGTTADLARALGCTWSTAKHHRQRYEERLRFARACDRPPSVLPVDEARLLAALGIAVCQALDKLVKRRVVRVVPDGMPTWQSRRWELVDARLGEEERHPIAVLRIVVELDPDLLRDLSPTHAAKLMAGIVCERRTAGVSIAWGLQVGRVERAQTFIDLAAAVAWLLERADGLTLVASLCPGTATAVYSLDRAAFLSAAVSILRRYAPRLWLDEPT